MDPGDRVFDTEDDDPNGAIVVRVPEGESIADWTYEKDGETVSAADENPDYSADAHLVNLTFEEYLDEEWPDWTTIAPADLWTGVRERDIPVYGFPEGRVGFVEPPAALGPVIERLEATVDALEWRPTEQHLHVEKMGETFRVGPDGTVAGEGIYADRLKELATDQTDESTHKYET